MTYTFVINKQLSIYADVHDTFPNWLENFKKEKSASVDKNQIEQFKLIVIKNFLELKSDQFILFMENLNSSILELVKSNVPQEIICGMHIIRAFLKICSNIQDNNIIQYQEMVQIALKNTICLPEVGETAASTLCRVCNEVKQSAFTKKQVSNEIIKSFEAFQDPSISVKLNSCKILSIFIEKVKHCVTLVEAECYYDNMWLLLGDLNEPVRVAGAYNLQLFVACLNERKEFYHSTFAKILSKIKQNIQLGEHLMHGALLALLSLLKSSDRHYFEKPFKDLCGLVLSIKSKNESVRMTIVQIFPLLASLDASAFASLYLKEVTDRLLANISNGQWISLVSLGHMATVYEKNFLNSETIIEAAINTCFQHIITLFQEPRGDKHLINPLVFDFLTIVVPVFNVKLTSKIKLIIEQLDLFDFCLSCKKFLKSVLVHIESLKLDITHYFLYVIDTVIVVGKELPVFTDFPSNKEDVEPERLILRTINLFKFSINSTANILETLTTNHLVSPVSATRKFAVEAIVHFVSDHDTYRCLLLIDILHKLLTHILIDEDRNIRLLIIKSLNIKRFDKYLIQPEFLKVLFLLLNDESFAIQEETISVLGRLSYRNPGFIGPRIRLLLMDYLQKLKLTEDFQEKGIVPHLVGRLYKYFPLLLKPYISPVIDILVKTIKTATSSFFLASNCISAIGYLILDPNDKQTSRNLLLLIIENFQDLSSTYKREVALESLRKLIVRTGYSVDPLEVYPPLLDLVLESILSASESMRPKLIHFLGTIGAVDPHKYKILHLELIEKNDQKSIIESEKTRENPGPRLREQDTIMKELLREISVQSDEYYPAKVLDLLMQYLTQHKYKLQMEVVENIMVIFKGMGSHCVPYFKHFIHPLIDVIKIEGPNCVGIREIFFKQLKSLVSMLKHYTFDYLELLINLMEEYWKYSYLQVIIIDLLVELEIVTASEFSKCFIKFLPKLLQSLVSNNDLLVVKTLQSLNFFGTTLDNHLHLVFPSLIDLLGHANTSITSEAQATVTRLAYAHDISCYSLKLIRKLVLLINGKDSNKESDKILITSYMDTITYVISSLSSASSRDTYLEMIQIMIKKKNIEHLKFNLLVKQIQENPTVIFQIPTEYASAEQPSNVADNQLEVTNRMSVSENFDISSFLAMWDVSCITSDVEWWEWLKNVAIMLLRQSPSLALRCVSDLAVKNDQIAYELFNVAFLSCWVQTKGKDQRLFITNFENALSSQTITSKVLHILLDLVEFMERTEKALPLDINKLGYLAQKSHAFAKALYYMEKSYKQNPRSMVDALITINNYLESHEAATGVLLVAQNVFNMAVDISWYEKLQKWRMCMEKYEDKLKEEPNNPKVLMGIMRCLANLGSWRELKTLACRYRSVVGQSSQQPNSFDSSGHAPLVNSDNSQVALFLTTSAFNLGEFDQLSEFIPQLEENSVKRLFYDAVVSVHHDEFDKALDYIKRARVLISPTLIALLGESYSRAYETIVRVQQLTELEEIIAYKQFKNEEAKASMREMWNRRLSVIAQNVEAWQDVLSVRALVLPKKTEAEQWVLYSHIVKKNSRFRRATKILEDLIVEMSGTKSFTMIPETVDPMVRYSYLELIWNIPEWSVLAYNEMARWVATFNNNPVVEVPKLIQARCYIDLAHWELQLNDNDLNDTIITSLVSHCKEAMQCDEKWYKVWHVWAIVNYRILTHYSKSPETVHKVFDYLLPAVSGFIRCIALAPTDTFQDTLRLITLWFNYGYKKDIDKALKEGFEMINIDTWLPVIPQIIARIHTSSVRSGIDQLLQSVGQKHPLALVFPIIVAFKSEIRSRKQAALNVMNHMRQHSPKLVSETLLVSGELIRVAILWKEKWRKGLDEAYHQYYYERNVHTMMSVLLPLHELLNSGVKTPNEVAFQKAFGKDLEKAWNCCKDFARTHNESCLHLAWDLYSHVFRIVKRQLQTDFEKLHLSLISPELSGLENLELAVPGTYAKSYRGSQPIVKIQKFGAILKVIPSKQRPRKLMIYGSDGNEYPFLLKGDEDLRQDERAMQLFGLINALLEADDGAQKRHLSIQTFSIIPLSADSGLITWLPYCDTLHELIKIYRNTHKIPIDAELSYIQRIVPREEYHQLPIIQKLEIFEYCLEQTKGDDLQQILWLNSQNAESWLEKRTTYTRSLAVMSMVGYILGLGDRHPNNIMFNRNSGKIIHIDFGDCFEVAMKREKFPERVPFRLTRMLVSAMEVSGVEGNFRISCKNTLSVLIENKESIMAVLEAFVYDPLINWDQNKKRNIGDDLSEVLNSKNNSGVSGSTNSEGSLSNNNMTLGMSPPTVRQSLSNVPSHSSSDTFDTSSKPTQNKKALTVLERISHKLNGTEFEHLGKLNIDKQVDLLIDQARSNMILCQSYLPWCPYW